MGQWVSLGGEAGGAFSGYLAEPPAGSGPGLLLIQEIWGVNEHIQSLADQYAADGFVVLAPDVFWRQQPRVDLSYDDLGTTQAYQHYQALDFSFATRDLSQALAFLKGLKSVNERVGALGFCMGGRLAFSLASDPNLDAGVSYYGSGIEVSQTQAQQAPFLFHFAGNDHLIPVDEALSLTEQICRRGSVEYHFYAGAQHGFNCSLRSAYQPPAALLAKTRTLSFLYEKLFR